MENTMIDDIKLVVTDDELSRYFRLQRILGYMCSYDENVWKIIKTLEDEKGTLIIKWQEKPSMANINTSICAWASVCGDGSNSVENYYQENIITIETL